MGPQIVKRFQGIETNDNGNIKDESAASRLVIIQSQWQMFMDNPLLGYGNRSTLLLSPNYIPREYREVHADADGVHRRASHNFFMAVLVDHGLIGGGLYFMVIFLCLKRLFFLKSIKKQQLSHNTDIHDYSILLTGLTLGLLAFMISGLGSNNKVSEIAIWMYAIIPLISSKITNLIKVEKC